MNDLVSLLLCLLVPVSYVGAAAVAHRWPSRTATRAALSATAGVFLLAIVLAAITAASGPDTVSIIAMGPAALSFRLDAVSLPILLLVTFVGLIVARFSRNYLYGDARQPIFYARLLMTLAATTVLVLAGDLLVFAAGWIALSLVLHGLLVLYPERPLAVLAARKKFIAARLGDLCLIAAFASLWMTAGTTDIATLMELAAGGELHGMLLPAMLIAVAALIKSAQLPFHGWITEVMEAPTPVSALLHAGIVNAGGFAVLRFSGLIAGQEPALWLLAFIGGGTAVFASVVMLTQSRVKTQLAWSTIAQMGFMMLQCGLGAFSAAFLHIVAHSLYKAHAFLWAGSVTDRSTSRRLEARPAAIFISYGLAATIFIAVGAAFAGALWEKPAIAVFGTVLVLGMGQAFAAGLSSGGGFRLMGRIGLAMVAVSTMYFLLQVTMAWLLAGSVPAAAAPSLPMAIFMYATISLFAALSIAQACGLFMRAPGWMHDIFVHASNGFYVNAVFNHMTGALRIKPTKS